MEKKVGVALDDYKRDQYKTEIEKAGYTIEYEGRLNSRLILFRIICKTDEEIKLLGRLLRKLEYSKRKN